MNKFFCKATACLMVLVMVLGTPQVSWADELSDQDEVVVSESELCLEENTVESIEESTEENTADDEIEEELNDAVSVSENTSDEKITTPLDASETDAWKLIDQMGAGWNLGNTLDCIDRKNYTSVKAVKAQNDYQLQLSYRSNPYTAWDACGYPYFDGNTGKVSLIWDLSKLKSTSSKACGALGFQIINHKLGDVDDQKLCVTVSKAAIVQADGTSTELIGLMGEHSLTIQNDVSSWVFENLSSYTDFQTTADIKTGIFTIEMEITSYPIAAEDSYVSSEKYYETLWNNPQASDELFSAVKSAGFSSVRIPVSYSDHIDKATGEISQAWLSRVAQVVSYALNHDLYCIINLHHESSWLNAEKSQISAEKESLANIWGQVGTYFQDYDEHLIFEGFNEIRDASGSWSATAESCEAVNELNQVFVDTIRNQDGNNQTRYLALETYAGSVDDSALEAFEIPEDTIQGRLFASVHCYQPQEFSWQQEDVSWTTTRSDFTDADAQKLAGIFDSMNQNLIEKGIPALVTEYGASNKNNTDDRIGYAKCIGNLGKEYHIGCFWWDAGGTFTSSDSINNGALFNRSSGEIYFPNLVSAIINPEEETSEEVEAFDLTKLVRTMVTSGDTSMHDISAEKITFPQLLGAWYTVINSEQIAYYTSKNLSPNFTTADGYVTTIGLKNVTDNFPEKYAAMQEAVNELLAQIPDEMSDLEKVLYVHDYLVYNGEYNLKNYQAGVYSDADHCAYGILVNHTGVCESYSIAFSLIMNLLDIPNKCIYSSTNHMWNAVEIDGKYYNLDMIYDDPCVDIRGRVNHNYFLCSDQEYQSGSHPHTGFTAGTCTDQKYENWFGHQVKNRMIYQDGYWIYVDTDGSVAKSKIDGTDKSILVDGANRNITSVVQGENKLFFADDTKIYSCDLNGMNEKLEKETETDISFLYISSDNHVYYTGQSHDEHEM